jgi:cellulose synthase/poly-beta-1,6-N-acetylglucosamine synthase-like glycosyltransferase
MGSVDWIGVATVVEWAFLIYFGLLQLTYFLLVLVAFVDLLSREPRRQTDPQPSVYHRYVPSVSIVLPAYNEEAMILEALRTMLAQDYPALQIVIVNDGSKDATLDRLKEAFALEAYDLPPRSDLESAAVRAVYRATQVDDVIVIDKENGGKADALNAGINYARHDLVCMIDADTVFEPDSIRRTVQEYLDHPETIAVGGTIMPLNGCERDENGFVTSVRLDRNFWARIQTLEYIRAFLLGRLGWVPSNALLIIPGAFGLFDRRAVVAVGGYRRDTVGEDMELTVRLHRWAREQKRKYRIGFVPDPVGWTEVPDSRAALRGQRIRWHQGLSETIANHRGLIFRNGLTGWFALPAQILFEWLSPVVELIGYALAVVALAFGLVSGEAVIAFLLMAVGLSMLLSMASVLLEEITLRVFPRLRDVFVLLAWAIIENIGYRQMHAVWRLRGLVRWAARRGYAWT